jgi:transposase-like protein
MRYAAPEKLEIIRLVEGAQLSARQTLAKLGIPRTTFYRWYDRYLQRGEAGLEDQSPKPKHVWKRIADAVRRKVVKLALKGDGAVAERTSGDLHGSRKLFCIRDFRIPRPQGARPDHQPSLYRDQGGE